MDKSQLLGIRIMIIHQHLDDYFEDSWKNKLDCVITSLKRASKVTNGLRIELSDLNYLCSHVFLASKSFHELNQTGWIMIHWRAGAKRCPLVKICNTEESGSYDMGLAKKSYIVSFGDTFLNPNEWCHCNRRLLYVQGDHSGCTKPPVDIKTKVCFSRRPMY